MVPTISVRSAGCPKHVNDSMGLIYLKKICLWFSKLVLETVEVFPHWALQINVIF